MYIAELEKTLIDEYKDRYAVTLAVGKRATQIAQNEQGVLSKDKKHKSVVSALIELSEGKSKIVLNS